MNAGGIEGNGGAMRDLRPSSPASLVLDAQEILALVKCHEENPWKKFLGACNDYKTRLDSCFRVRATAGWRAGEVG